MPTRPQPYAQPIQALIGSTSYPALPPIDELEALRSALDAHAASASTRLAQHSSSSAHGGDEERRKKKKQQQRERDEAETRERAAIEANEKAGVRLEVVERRKKEASVAGDVKRERKSLSPAPSNASSASFRPQPHIKTYGTLHKKQKKQRIADSDDETASAHTASTSGLKLKLGPSVAQHKARPVIVEPSPTPPATSYGAGLDFSLPPQPQRPLVPPRPGVQKPMKPGPKKQSEVDEDFSDKKAPNQVNFQTFWQNIEPYIRDIREDDLAMLNFKSFDIPPRGRHYTEVWDEEDRAAPGTTPRVSVPNMRPLPAVLPRFNPGDMREENLAEEHRGLGAFTERIAAAFVGGEPDVPVGVPAEADSDVPRDGVRDVVELEDRVKKELRLAMLLGEHEEFDPHARDDDEVTSALRLCQRLLLQQTTINDARKARLAELAKRRIAHHEYQATLDGIDKTIETAWAKRIKKHGAAGRRVLQPATGEVTGAGRPAVPEQLKKLVETRRGWIERVGGVFRDRPAGEVAGLPGASVYDGVGEDNEETDEKTVEDAMDVDDLDADEVDGLAV